MGSHESDFNKSLELLKEQYEEYEDVICRDHIMSLQDGIFLLNHFSSSTINEDLKMCIIRVFHEVRLELHSISGRPKDGNRIQDLDRGYINLREMMKNVITNSETREYDIIWGSDRFQSKIYTSLLSILDEISRQRADAVDPKMKEIEEFKEKLMLLEPLVEYGPNLKDSTEYYKLLDAFLDKAACLIYTYVVDKMDEETTLAMKHKLTDLVKEIYTEILTKPYNFTYVPPGEEFFLLDRMLELLDLNASVYLNDSGKKLHNKLKFLKFFRVIYP